MQIKIPKYSLKRRLLLHIFMFFCLAGSIVFPNQGRTQVADSVFSKIEDFGHYMLYRNHDTSFIANLGNEISVRLVGVNKYNYFRIYDNYNKTRLRYFPLRDLSIGAGVSYRWFSLDVTISLGLSNNSELENTRSLDFQGNIFSSKQFIAATLQYYQGFNLGSSGGLSSEVPEESRRREDIRTINFGLQYMFAMNYTRFSMKAPFVFNEVQKKSAGSPIIGASFGIFTMDSDTSIVPPAVAGQFDSSLYVSDMSIIMGAFNFGYMYTFVYKKHFFLTLSLIPGINISSGDYFNTTREYIRPNGHLKINSMNSIGYNGRKFHAGFNLIVDTYFTSLEKKMLTEIGHGKFNVFVGYRFPSKRSKK